MLTMEQMTEYQALKARRYLVYRVDQYYPAAFQRDVVAAFAEADEAIAYAETVTRGDTIAVVDATTGDPIWSYRPGRDD